MTVSPLRQDLQPLLDRLEEGADDPGWEPPPCGEILAAELALPPDLEDPGQLEGAELSIPAGCTFEQAYAHLAEGAFVLARVGGAPPADLVLELDAWLARRSGWAHADPFDLRTMMAVGFGALVGLAMVGELGGRWLPRRNVLETQVQVGGWVFFPMLRALRAVTTRPDGFLPLVIEASLTALLASARRARAGEVPAHQGPDRLREALLASQPPRCADETFDSVSPTALAFDGHGRLLVGRFDELLVFDLASHRLVAAQPYNFSIKHLCGLPDPAEVLTMDATGTARIWNIGSGRRVAKVGLGSSETTRLACTADGRRLAWGQGKKVIVWDRPGSPRVVAQLSAYVCSVVLVGDVVWCATGQRKIQGYDLASGAHHSVATGKQAATWLCASRTGAVAVALQDGSCAYFPEGPLGARGELSSPDLFSEDGTECLRFTAGVARRHRISDGALLAEAEVLPPGERYGCSPAVSADLQRVAAYSHVLGVPGTLRVLNLASPSDHP